MLGKVVVVVMVLCLGMGATVPQPRDESLNNYIDLVLDNLQVLVMENGLDPAPLPNGTVGFSDVVLGVEWHGEATVYNGWLRGLSGIYRTENADFIQNAEGSVIGLKTGMGLGDMKGHYTCLAQFMDLGPIADVIMDIAGASIYFEAALDQSTCHFQVSVMEVTDIGHIKIDITGLGLLDWIFEIVAQFVVNILRIFIKDTVENIIMDLTNQVLGSLDLGPLAPIVGCEVAQHPFMQPRPHLQ